MRHARKNLHAWGKFSEYCRRTRIIIILDYLSSRVSTFPRARERKHTTTANHSKLPGTKIRARSAQLCFLAFSACGRDRRSRGSSEISPCGGEYYDSAMRKIIGGRPRTLFILIANILFAHDDEAARFLLCTRAQRRERERDSSIYCDIQTFQRKKQVSPSNIVELNIRTSYPWVEIFVHARAQTHIRTYNSITIRWRGGIHSIHVYMILRSEWNISTWYHWWHTGKFLKGGKVKKKKKTKRKIMRNAPLANENVRE